MPFVAGDRVILSFRDEPLDHLGWLSPLRGTVISVSYQDPLHALGACDLESCDRAPSYTVEVDEENNTALSKWSSSTVLTFLKTVDQISWNSGVITLTIPTDHGKRLAIFPENPTIQENLWLRP